MKSVLKSTAIAVAVVLAGIYWFKALVTATMALAPLWSQVTPGLTTIGTCYMCAGAAAYAAVLATTAGFKGSEPKMSRLVLSLGFATIGVAFAIVSIAVVPGIRTVSLGPIWIPFAVSVISVGIISVDVAIATWLIGEEYTSHLANFHSSV